MYNYSVLLGKAKDVREFEKTVAFLVVISEEFNEKVYESKFGVTVFKKEHNPNPIPKEGDLVLVTGRLKHEKYTKDGKDVWKTIVNANTVKILAAEPGETDGLPF